MSPTDMTLTPSDQPIRGTPIIRDCSAADVPRVVALLDEIWGASNGSGPISAAMLHALRHTGACLRVVAGPGGRPRGALIAFRETRDPQLLHLHVVGVAPDSRGAGLGGLLMRDLERRARTSQFTAIEWTFDPLIARNAHLYLAVLGARPVEYLTDPYGQIDDAVNGGHGSDRLRVRWDLSRDTHPTPTWPTAPALLELDAEGAPCHLGHEASLATLAVPQDIEGLRKTAPEIARRWRAVTRLVLEHPLTSIRGFDRDRGYLIERGGPEEAR